MRDFEDKPVAPAVVPAAPGFYALFWSCQGDPASHVEFELERFPIVAWLIRANEPYCAQPVCCRGFECHDDSAAAVLDPSGAVSWDMEEFGSLDEFRARMTADYVRNYETRKKLRKSL